MREQYAKKLLESSYNDLAKNKLKLDIQQRQPPPPPRQQQHIQAPSIDDIQKFSKLDCINWIKIAGLTQHKKNVCNEGKTD